MDTLGGVRSPGGIEHADDLFVALDLLFDSAGPRNFCVGFARIDRSGAGNRVYRLYSGAVGCGAPAADPIATLTSA